MKTLIFSLLAPLTVFAQILTVKTMEEAKPYFDNLSSQDLAIFDIDDVLVTPSHPAFQLRHMKLCWPFLKQLSAELGEQKTGFFAYSACSSEPELLEAITPSLLQALQQKNTKTIALTANFPGKFAHFEDFCSYKLGKLQALGIEFFDGAIFSGKTPKGIALLDFLQANHLKPRRVLFIDDRKDNLENVAEALYSFDPSLEYIGLEYTYSLERSEQTLTAAEVEKHWRELADEWKKIVSFTALEDAFSQADQDTLILFDLGGTLIYNSAAVMQTEHEAWKRAWFQKNYPQLSLPEKLELVKIVESASDSWFLVDPRLPPLIKKAQDRGLKIQAFTKVIRDPAFVGLRAAKLAELGIVFQNEFPELGQYDSFGYDRGIIETDRPLKGPVLLDFLAKLPQSPKKIIFIDDRQEQIDSVSAVCLTRGIPVQTFLWDLAPKTPLDEELADHQLHTLVLHKRWLH